MSVVKDDRRGMDELQRTLRELARSSVTVGVHGETKRKDGVNAVLVASVHEFGAVVSHPGGTPFFPGKDGLVFVSKAKGARLPKTRPHRIVIPERSFIRSTFDEQRGRFERLATRLAIRVVEGALGKRQFFDALGEAVTKAMQKRIADGIEPPLKASTIQRRQLKTAQGRRQLAKGELAQARALIDSGQLRQSITFQVHHGGGAR